MREHHDKGRVRGTGVFRFDWQLSGYDVANDTGVFGFAGHVDRHRATNEPFRSFRRAVRWASLHRRLV